MTLKKIKRIPVPKCQRCGRPGKRRRQNTSYVNDEMNWATLCDECQKESDEYWKDMWAEYYRMVL